ncbi:hypothetical protein [Actinoplanes teichomyceticus]|uniref:Uncharacterized protein n=1 Tax=Actinoplanes teichomyceticus TaxID=1867 RepID=A0A561VMX1_ACTTI|nr:hypothetical protein [Actinoplanes teichomyceticus]TWG12942.1 hypothetical protein FHX34_105810 [Actinoplanes teichomyceticus]GIF13696.1 hypothetical protein Ate01nite_37280 [Actinoplanes teichomyceticus]
MSRPWRAGTWRQAVITYSAVLPVSLVLHLVLGPLTAPWPRLSVIVVNAAVLVASLNWVLLPALHRVTRGWAVRSAQKGAEEAVDLSRGST